MQHRNRLVLIAIAGWTLFGMVVIAAGIHFLLGYSRIPEAIAVGAVFGAVIGLIVGLVAVSPVVSPDRPAAMLRSMLLASMVGAVLGVAIMCWLGGFPTRTQADLTLVLLAPASLVVGVAVGIIGAIVVARMGR